MWLRVVLVDQLVERSIDNSVRVAGESGDGGMFLKWMLVNAIVIQS